MTILRRSLRDVLEHAHTDAIVQKWLAGYKVGDKFEAKYIGWAECRMRDNGERKHPEAICFTYYEINIGGEVRYLNAKVHKDFGGIEVVYTIEDSYPLDLIAGAPSI